MRFSGTLFTPGKLQETLKQVPVGKLAVHVHDTYGQALTNVMLSLRYGISTVVSLAPRLAAVMRHQAIIPVQCNGLTYSAAE